MLYRVLGEFFLFSTEIHMARRFMASTDPTVLRQKVRGPNKRCLVLKDTAPLPCEKYFCYSSESIALFASTVGFLIVLLVNRERFSDGRNFSEISLGTAIDRGACAVQNFRYLQTLVSVLWRTCFFRVLFACLYAGENSQATKF